MESPSTAPVSSNPYSSHMRSLRVGDQQYNYYQLRDLGQEKYGKMSATHWVPQACQIHFTSLPLLLLCSCVLVDQLPFSIRVLLESGVRNCDGFQVKEKDVETILNWQENTGKGLEIAFRPARVILQDFT